MSAVRQSAVSRGAGGHVRPGPAVTTADGGSRRHRSQKAQLSGWGGPEVDVEGLLVVTPGCGFWVVIFKLLLL